MRLLDSLREEHQRIEQVIGSLQTYADRRAAGVAGPEDAEAYLRFFALYAGRFHHAREEDVLFPALVERTEAPGDRGPLQILLQAHRAIAALLARAEPLLRSQQLSPEQATGLRALVERHGRALLQHIDAENSVLFPESETRLRRAGVQELDDRPPDAEEAEARDHGARLVALHPPREIAGILRGDGCPACEAYGSGCDGIEREWWSELEWEDVHDRIG